MRYLLLVVVAMAVYLSVEALLPSLPRSKHTTAGMIGPARGSGLRLPTTALQLDFFGLGPPEVVVFFVAVTLLFGPDRVKAQLQAKDDGKIVSKGWRADRAERIVDMQTYAQKTRRRRALDRVNEALEEEEPYVVQRKAEYESK
jgi:hypothetical protein